MLSCEESCVLLRLQFWPLLRSALVRSQQLDLRVNVVLETRLSFVPVSIGFRLLIDQVLYPALEDFYLGINEETQKKAIDAANRFRRGAVLVAPQPGRSILQRRDDVIYAEQLAPGRAAYAQAVRVGDLVFVSDQQGVEAQGRLVGPGDIGSQTRQALANLQTILQLFDLSLEDVVKTTVMLTDWRHYAAYNDVYARFFQAPYPARSTICAGIARPERRVSFAGPAGYHARHDAPVTLPIEPRPLFDAQTIFSEVCVETRDFPRAVVSRAVRSPAARS